MNDQLKKRYIWWIVYLLIEFLLIYVFKFRVNDKFLYLGIIGILYIYINLFFIEYKRERLLINGIVSFISVILTGILIGNLLSLLQIVCIGISISDVLSFTKYGKNTANAKAMSNPIYLSKLMVYGKGKGGMLYSTCGLGDYLYFSLWISGLSENINKMMLLCFAILIGN